MKNDGMIIVSKVKRLFVEDLLCSSEINQDHDYKKMPSIFSMLVSNPLLEQQKLISSEPSETTTDSRWLDENYDINNTLEQLIIRIRNTKTELNIEFMFNHFRVIINEKTIVRLFEFVFKIGHSLNSKDNQLDKIKEEIIKFQKSMNPSGNPSTEMFDDMPEINTNNRRSLMESMIKMRQDYLVKEKKIKNIRLEKLEEKHRINVIGTINSLQVWVPLEWSETESKLMSFYISADATYYSLAHRNYYINSLTNSIFKLEHISNVDDMKVVAKGFKIMIENIKEADQLPIGPAIVKSIEEDFVRSMLLKCPRIEFSFDKEAKIKIDITDAAIVVQLMPIVVNVGFVEINEFITVYKRLFDVYTSIMEKNQNIINKVSQNYEEVKATVSEMVTDYFTSMVDADVTGNQAKVQVPKSRLAKTKIINLTKILVFVEKIQMSLIDDIGLYHQPLVTLDIDSLRSSIQIEDGKESAASFMLRKLGYYEDPYIKGDLVLDLKAYNFNFESGVSEPFIEPWSLKLNIKKVFRYGFDLEGIYTLESNKSLNINLTYGMTHVVKKAIDNIGNTNISVEDTIRGGFDSNMSDDQDQYFEFINNLGCDLKIAVEDYLDLKLNRLKSLQKNLVNESYAVIELKANTTSAKYNKNLLVATAQKLGIMKKHVSTKYDRLILRMDVCIEDMNGVSAVPIEFAGVRSYQVTPFDDTSSKPNTLSFVVNVESLSNGQITRVSFESPIVISNNCDFPMTILYKNNTNDDISKLQEIEIEPNKVFLVPFTWVRDNTSIFYKCQIDGEVEIKPLIENIHKSLLIKNSKDTSNFKSDYFPYQKNGTKYTMFSLDMYAFRCKPLNSKSPLQYLVSINPPM